MPSRIDEIVSAIARLERELEQEMHGAHEKWRYRVDAGRVRFHADVREAHRRLKNSIPRFLRESHPLHILIAPVLYSLIVPIVILDLWTSAYQWICFPVFRVPIVRRSSYVVIDRHHLSYLNPIEKMNCLYCGYANGVFAYVREIAGRTEQYWCPIKHATRVRGAHAHYRAFVDFGDADGYRRRLPLLRAELRDEGPATTDDRRDPGR